MPKLRVAVLMGGRSTEREVSLSTGRQVLAALDPGRYEAFGVDVAAVGMLPPAHREPRTAALPPASEGTGPHLVVAQDAFRTPAAPALDEHPLFGRRRPDVAVICLHGQYGEDGTVQGLLELLGIPYTGSGVLASALAMDKAMSKKLFLHERIPTPESVTLVGRGETDRFLAEARMGNAPLAPPVVVKPNQQGSTIGISIARTLEELPAGLGTALAYDETVLVEQFIDGVEITAAMLGNDELRVLPLIEIVPSTGFYDYEQKYTPGATEEIVPARIAPEAAARAESLAVRAHRALGCRGVSRVDMIVGGDEVWVLEVNTIPGMTPTSLLPRAAEAAGIPFPRLLDRLIELALEGRMVETGCECAL